MVAEIRNRRRDQVEADVRRLLARKLPDADLRAELEVLARQWAFSGLTWLWGPELYRRNKVLFRSFILAHFGSSQFVGGWSWEQVAWKGKVAEVLEPWLAEADRTDDIELFRRLYLWKAWGNTRDDAKVRGELLRRLPMAATPAQRAVVLDKFNLWLELDEPTALKIYALEPAAGREYIFRHLPFRWGWSGEKRTLWTALVERARAHGDDAFAMRLYRRQAPLERWEADALALCQSERDPAALCARLHDHHPEGWNQQLDKSIQRLVDARGRDVVPYVLKHLKDIWPRFWGRGGYGKLLDRAYAEGWWDLWAGLLRVCAKVEDWNAVVRKLSADRTLPEQELTRRLLLLTGVGREWNFAGFGMAQVQQLDDAAAGALYERFPALVRGPFKVQLQTGYWTSLPKFVRRVLAANDEALIDFLASRLVNRAKAMWLEAPDQMDEAAALADYFEALRSRDEHEFARRAANVLTQVPAYTFFGYGRAVRDNRLARLLLERSLDSFLGDPVALRDLVEASEIHVQHLSYRILGLDDDRARAAAVDNLDILIGTLLRPLQRPTRLAALGALANAASTLDHARRILGRAREALTLPDRKYPKEAVIGLIGKLLARWPELRGPAEQPVVYRRAEAVT
jgi:hypothetical protein